MNGDSSLVVTLVDRLITRLPHRTGSDSHDLNRDEIVVLTRETLINIGISSIGIVADTLVQLLEELSKPYKGIAAHPVHVVHSELYVLGLLAECCAKNWEGVNAAPSYDSDGGGSTESEDLNKKGFTQPATRPLRNDGRKRASRSRADCRDEPPEALEEALVKRILDAVKVFSNPVSDSYVLPAAHILDDALKGGGQMEEPLGTPDSSSIHSNGRGASETAHFLLAKFGVIESCTRTVVEFVSSSNWAQVLEYLRTSLRGLLATHPTSGNPTQTNLVAEDDRSALVTIRLIANFWVDSRKLSVVIQELCASFLHLRKAFQTAVAIVLPLLITRWLERNPEEFIELHSLHKRLDGGAETLFDMTVTMIDGGRRKTLLFPFQTSLLFLLPDVFEVASNMREVKSSSIAKKVSFLEMLRKSLRNRNETGIYCLVSVLRVARLFPLSSDAALLSYALDVQEEIREAVFRRHTADTNILDIGLMTAAFVSLSHLNIDTCVQTLTPFCLAINAPEDFKIAVMNASAHLAKQPDGDDYGQLFATVCNFIRNQLQGLANQFRENEDEYNTNLKQKHIKLGSSIELMYSILVFLDAAPLALFYSDVHEDRADWAQTMEDLFAAFMSFLISDDESIRSFSARVCRRVMVEGVKYLWRKAKCILSPELKWQFWSSSSQVFSAACNKLVSGTGDERYALGFLADQLSSRVTLLTEVEGFGGLEQEIPARMMAYTKLETALLVSSCSADIAICEQVTACISLLLREIAIVNSAATFAKSSSFSNIKFYNEISSRDFRFTGLVAFQKRSRSLLRQFTNPTTGIMNAWECIFDRWHTLSKQFVSRSPEVLEERSFNAWRNYSGFLASLGGVCMSETAPNPDEQDHGLGVVPIRWIDRLSPDGANDTLLKQYMRQSVQLLASSHVRVREATRDVLCSELAKALHIPLFETLEAELEVLCNAGVTADSRIVFAEQAASLLKSIVERLGGPTDFGAGVSIDIGALTLNFAKYLNMSTEGSSTLRVKIKICQLCETLSQKKELLNLRHDVRIRNQLLGVIFGWIARPGSDRVDRGEIPVNIVGSRMDEMLRLQGELDKACLKALAVLTYRLPLQPAEGQTDADTSDLKSTMFHTYFNRFLSLLNYETNEIRRSEARLGSLASDEKNKSTPELAITALSNLLSANIDVGLKHSLSIGYHEDLDVRTAFVKVLCNILIQGTEFNNLSDVAVNQKYDELLDLLINDLTLTIALCDACPSSEVDEMTISLLNIFDSRGLGFVLLEALIEHEVEETENEAELLRRNCVATKMLSAYARWKGAAYLKATLQKVLERLVLTSKDLDLELDPARTSGEEELQKNALQLRVVTKVFIDDICNSSPRVPVSFRRICSIISTAVMKRFPEAKFTAVGAFIFLRFFCPAIVAPDAEGLIAAAPSKEMRRGLLLIAKVVQNLANNVLFGAKEPYMFPLNDFLTQNIYRVTTFLREISAPPNISEPVIDSESFDFGSCVALHRFLYDHWDHVRQKLVLRERRETLRGSSDDNKFRTPILESLRKLINNLGPPPMDVSWNRPAVTQNSPPSYSRFQHFMLRNAGRSSESIVSTHAVYDGGESKDGVSMICIILRNIDTEATDFDLLLYVYLKIASRMWHKPFGILIDATCYNGQNEPQDALFRKLDMLTPKELSRQLSRVYVYNMNSAFRKCFRRILRLSAKSENSAFHPKNVDYHLIGTLQELQTHFHLSQLHLPKETISVVTDTRYLFQPITRLSKTKGKIEVKLKVGSQFVQVTTVNKQEVVPGLRLHATVNDIFRLSEVDEAPTSIQTEDDSAFGLRTENGKIVMYFTSPRKADILQAVRSAKAKYGKELRTRESFERLVRPQDVPGTLLNIALSNMGSTDQILRLSSYNLLSALCRAFKFAANTKFMDVKELCVPLNPSRFIVEISEQLAQSEPQLTGDFLNEFFVGWDSFPYAQRPLSLAYMAPWLPSLRTHLIPNEADSDKAREKVAAIFRKLIEVAISDVVLSTTLEQSVWPIITRDEICIDIFLEEIVKSALGFGIDDERTEILGSIVSSMGTITIRGKLLSRLRKALNRTSLRPTRQLPENTVWTEICVLLRLCLSTSFDSGVQAQLYLPEIFHLVTMLANTGSPEVRLIVSRLLVNTIHSMCTTWALEDNKLARLKALVALLGEPRQDSLFSMASRDGTINSQDTGASALNATECLAVILAEISVIAAPSIDMSNTWRSRWMSLVASTAFQSNPAIQPRAFTVMGCLAREDVDDDLLYQVLVALRTSIGRFMDDNDSEMLIAIVTSLTKMMDKLPSASRYGLQLFWLAVSLVRLVPMNLFNCTALFLDAVLANISTSGEFSNKRMVSALLQGRVPLEDAALQLDEMYGIHFTSENFHFAVCATLVKGLTDSVTKSAATRVIETFMSTVTNNLPPRVKFPDDYEALAYLGLLTARSINPDDMEEKTWYSDMLAQWADATEAIKAPEIKDKEVLLNCAISIVDFHYLEDNVQHRELLWLGQVAILRPSVIQHLSGPISSILDDVIISCQNKVTLDAAHQLLRTLASSSQLSSVVDMSEMLEDVLEGIGFGGLWRSSTFHGNLEVDRQCTAMTDRLIELIIA